METKRITDLTILESVSDAANVLVEENGEAKRVPANMLGGASSWNDLTDKPFYDEDVVVMEEQTVSISAGEPTFIEGIEAPPVGVDITVKVNGVEYSGVTAEAEGAVSFGNLALAGNPDLSDTGEPVLVIFAQGMAMLFFAETIGASCTVSIKSKRSVKIPARYVDTRRVFYVNPLSDEDYYLYTDANMITKATFADLRGAASTTNVVLSYIDNLYCYPLIVNFVNEYGLVIAPVGHNRETDTVSNKIFYTAEYTAS